MALVMHLDRPMSMVPDAGDLQSLELRLCFASDPGTGAFEVTLEFREIEVKVEVVDVDLRRAIRTAADRCAEKLRDEGFQVTPDDVIGALEDALEHSEFANRLSKQLN
jgi:hypothetical protein